MRMHKILLYLPIFLHTINAEEMRGLNEKIEFESLHYACSSCVNYL